ncbi:PREDICTED: 3-hydroxyisobutyryl-CoA hydrolase, mitochondrial [Rhagoletis zephyria]|uniref:3-hydroxyisobutyryl-CoA hydrolase, mitochondrial n=1 Tax=Rhagoletis zephyria TaxID=28612 RepID=UPI0008116E77|nr:PREDICTED: 3-hydroxyisobutyryl-CoA hydrolase, mitochondrial [Rhagoletis zephyria]XP_017491561.1 PREDICTED: 3-hydroxyisobutyryl-CoA hydrolase, mitochondrial [Rhagoletis zephyria]XP_036320589.1 3-hydroxyisobutyryl-CoA hydrolase, mitochondrial [Rhagoletis pomonella]
MHPIQRIIYAFGHRTFSMPILTKKPSSGSIMASLINVRENSSFVLAPESSDKGMIILNRPNALNALNLDMTRKIYKHLKKCELSKLMVIIKGAGGKAFCAGGDVRSIVEAGPTEESKAFFREEYTLNALIGNYIIPYIAIMDGITMGGGVGLSVHGKYRIATERTLLAMPETAIGLFPDVGGSYFLPRLQGKLGLFLGLTGFRLKGDDVLKAGIATHYCESTKLGDLQNDLLNCKDADIVPNILEKYNSPSKNDFILNAVMDKINKCFTANSVEEIVENLKRDGSDWSNKTLETLGKVSPLSLKVTFRELELGSKLLLPQCLKMEYRMVVRHLEDSDFKEGVRALLIDKDQMPRWNPSTLEAVTEERVDWFFRKLPDTDELKL